MEDQMIKQSMQEVFDKVCTELVKQGKRAYNKNLESCQYRMYTDDGTQLKCAVGHLLTDDQISKYGIRYYENPKEFPTILIQELVPNVSTDVAVEFLLQLQKAHDDSSSDENFVSIFIELANLVAAKNNLKQFMIKE